MIKTLGITGGLGSGKTTACKIFRKLGCEIFDADIEAKNILFSDPKVKIDLINNFGKTIVKDGKIDKNILSKVVFSTKKNQEILNNIIHPLVTEEFLRRRKKITSKIYIMDAALLFEANLQSIFDKTILVYTDKNIRISRAMKRGNLSEEQIIYRMNLQMDEKIKKELADIVITNNSSEKDLQDKIAKLYTTLHNFI